ncbi:MAG: PQQ-binding-like beta-propeller repeat protein [Pirellulales bacterium]
MSRCFVLRLQLTLASLMGLSIFLASTPATAENWPNWRGPRYDGTAAGDAYPTKWSETENVAWKIKLPGKGSSTPIVWGERIFLTYGADEQNVVACFDRHGKPQWTTPVGKEKPGKHKKATGSNPSAVTDGRHVFVYFKSGDLACLTFDGRIAWEHNLQSQFGEDTLWWDLGTSPVVTQSHVVVAVMHSGPSFLVAYEKDTGKLAWKQDRNLDAPSEAAQSYSTPVVLQQGDQERLVVLGADHVTAHDAATGKELWRVGGLNPTGHQYFRSIASAVVGDQIVVAPYARGASLTGIKLGGSGDVTKSHVAWSLEGLGADVPTPVVKDGKVYVCTDKGDVACLELATGKTLWKGAVERNRNAYSSSPILAGGHLYITREDGKTFVAAAGEHFKVVAENSLADEFVVATPVFVDGQILIRTLDSLYCIGKK